VTSQVRRRLIIIFSELVQGNELRGVQPNSPFATDLVILGLNGLPALTDPAAVSYSELADQLTCQASDVSECQLCVAKRSLSKSPRFVQYISQTSELCLHHPPIYPPPSFPALEGLASSRVDHVELTDDSFCHDADDVDN
jgi:hypothetical protein